MFCDIFDWQCVQHVVAVWPTIGGFPFSVYLIIYDVMSQKTFVFEQTFDFAKRNLLYITGTVKYVYAKAALLSIVSKYVYYVAVI
jgi:hypothetical protein